MTASDWDTVTDGGDADPYVIFGETPEARQCRALLMTLSRSDVRSAGRQDLFFGPAGETWFAQAIRVRRAKALCFTCPAQSACLEYALASGERHGVWAGLAQEELAVKHRRAQDGGGA